MPSTSADSNAARPMAPRAAAVINEEIRDLVEGGRVGSEAYLELLVEWAAAVRTEVVEAA
ncbi:hypothetical protein [Streptomyces sp. NPDC050504]|uniref:hypothetical protein n=1 Tax=Streptomyces sp. NPDC050504 TaxID=3365618 RepID=UPI0037A8245F